MPDNIPFVLREYSEDDIKFSVIDIEDISDDLRKFIDEKLCQICVGEEDNLENIKLTVKRNMGGWTERTKMGAVAEFFIHLYANLVGYRQECMFLNAEEKSIKKGFDGVYSLNGELWIMESKSGLFGREGVSHSEKIKEAFDDLNKKITTDVSNDPWRNAYNHAKIVNTKKNLREALRKLSDDFINNKYPKIEDMNIVPCGTIFLDGEWVQFDADNIVEEVKNLGILKGKNIHVICITQKTYKMFIEYLG